MIEDEAWWAEHGGAVEANWESDSLRRYSTLDTEGIKHLVHDVTWSNEGLFAFSEGLRRLAELDTTQRVAAPFIDVEA